MEDASHDDEVEATVVGIGHAYAIHAVEVREEGVGVAGEMAVVVGEDFAEEFGFGVGECFDHVSSVVAVKEELSWFVIEKIKNLNE